MTLVWAIVGLLLLLALLVVWGMAFQNRGVPYPFWIRRSRRARSYGAAPSPLDEELVEVDPAVDPIPAADDRWGVVADIIWIVVIAAVVLLVFVLVAQ